ncbi:MAG: PHB depolymerase family esterase [Anaeromyxobacter sp.]
MALRALATFLVAGLSLACASSGDGDGGPARTYGGDRPVTLQVPPDLQDGQRYPLVLILHGHGSSGAGHQLYFQVFQLPALRQAFVLAPDGTRDALGLRFWNMVPEQGSAVDDVAYLGGLLDQVMADWPIDPARVVVLGHSNGAFMAYRLACDRADVVTAIGGLAGADVSGHVACEPARPVSVLHVHGDEDAVVLYEGGSLGPDLDYPGAAASALTWAGYDACDGDATAGSAIDLAHDVAGEETLPHLATGCPAGVAVELWTIQGGSHAPTLAYGAGLRLIDWLLAHPRP